MTGKSYGESAPTNFKFELMIAIRSTCAHAILRITIFKRKSRHTIANHIMISRWLRVAFAFLLFDNACPLALPSFLPPIDDCPNFY
jgi:hypothetical protein